MPNIPPLQCYVIAKNFRLSGIVGTSKSIIFKLLLNNNNKLSLFEFYMNLRVIFSQKLFLATSPLTEYYNDLSNIKRTKKVYINKTRNVCIQNQPLRIIDMGALILINF